MSDATFLATFFTGMVCGALFIAIVWWTGDHLDEWEDDE